MNDANDWKAALEGRGFTVEQLLERQATKAAMVDAMTRLVTEARTGDTIVIQCCLAGAEESGGAGDIPGVVYGYAPEIANCTVSTDTEPLRLDHAERLASV